MTCTAAVSDTAAGYPTTPTGTVSFTATLAGQFSPTSSCRLDATASCAVTYQPGSTGAGTVTAGYSGDSAHRSSQGSAQIVVSSRSSATAVSCSPANVSVGDATTCTATVSDTGAGTTVWPTGTVTFTTSGAGTFDSTTCWLSGKGSCATAYRPSATGSQQITSSYGGDSAHAPSSGTFTITGTTGKPTVLTAYGPGGAGDEVSPTGFVHCPPEGDCPDVGAGIAVKTVRLTDADGNPIEGEPIIFDDCYYNSPDCGGPVLTDSEGFAVELSDPSQWNGRLYPTGYSAYFPGDGTYAGSNVAWSPPA